MKSLFIATIAVVFMLFIGWSIFSDSTESNNSGQVRREAAENFTQTVKAPETVVEQATDNDNSVTSLNELPYEEKSISANNDPAIEAENTIAEMESESDATNRFNDKFVRQSFGKRLPERKIQPNPGDMPNDKFMKEMEKHQIVSYRNYDEILRLAK